MQILLQISPMKLLTLHRASREWNSTLSNSELLDTSRTSPYLTWPACALSPASNTTRTCDIMKLFGGTIWAGLPVHLKQPQSLRDWV